MAADLVLVIDPSRTIHRMVDSALSKEGFEVVCQGTSQAAAEFLSQRQPQLVLLETATPGLAENGVFAILSALTRAENGATLILSTADTGQGVDFATRHGIVYASVLEKPFAAKALKVTVGKLMQSAAPAQPTTPLPQATPPPLPPAAAHPPAPSAVPTMPAGMPPPPPSRPRITPAAAPLIGESVRTPLPPPVPAPAVTPAPAPIPAPAIAPPPPVPAPVATPATAPRQGLAEYEFDCPAALVSGREALVYLNNAKVTGLLSITSEEESVLVFFNEGEVCFLSSDNPTIYLGDATSPWKKTSENSLAAYEEQGRTGKPFILTLNQLEVRLHSNQLKTMLRRAGEDALVRALFTRKTRLRFQTLQALPEYTQEFEQSFSLIQLLLLSYRAVRGWETIEKEIAHSGVVVNFTRYFEGYADQLDLNDVEAKVISCVDGHHSVAEIAQETGLSTLEVGAVLYGFIRLGLIAVTLIPDSTAVVSPM